MEHKPYKILRVQPTPNPEAFQFIMNSPVISSGNKTYNTAEEIQGNAMAEALFKIYGIENVYLQESFVTVTKSEVVGWHNLLEQVSETIEKHLTFSEAAEPPKEPAAASPVLEGFKKEDFVNFNDEQKTQVIEAVLDTAIRPALANDGGGLEIVGIEGNVVIVHYQGACGSCPSSTTGTLSYIENFLKESVHSDLKVHSN